MIKCGDCSKIDFIKKWIEERIDFNQDIIKSTQNKDGLLLLVAKQKSEMIVLELESIIHIIAELEGKSGLE